MSRSSVTNTQCRADSTHLRCRRRHDAPHPGPPEGYPPTSPSPSDRSASTNRTRILRSRSRCAPRARRDLDVRRFAGEHRFVEHVQRQGDHAPANTCKPLRRRKQSVGRYLDHKQPERDVRTAIATRFNAAPASRLRWPPCRHGGLSSSGDAAPRWCVRGTRHRRPTVVRPSAHPSCVPRRWR